MNYKCKKCGLYWYNPKNPKECPKCGSKEIKEK